MFKQSLSKYLPREPITIDEHSWFYIDSKGMLVVKEVLNSERTIIQTEQILVPWNEIAKGLKGFREAKRKQSLAMK